VISLRPIVSDDFGPCAQIFHDAFRDVATRHGFPPIFAALTEAANVMTLFERFPVIVGIVAELDGRPAGVVYFDEGDPIRAIALIGVDPAAQGRGIGRRLMEAALARCERGRGVRLVQEAYNTHAMSLYASLGFDVKEPLVRVTGKPAAVGGHGQVRPLTLDDLTPCADLIGRVHGIDRSNDLRDAIGQFRPFGLERGGRIVALTYAVFGGSLAWGVAETDDDLRALLAGVAAAVGVPLAFLLPTRAAALFRWALAEGFRVEKPLTLMARGEYHEPRGAWFPSGFY
jgi:GNAT superfamily N-acetyltransferase